MIMSVSVAGLLSFNIDEIKWAWQSWFVHITETGFGPMSLLRSFLATIAPFKRSVNRAFDCI